MGCPGGPCTHTPHLKGASYRGNALLSRLEWAVVHFERGRPGDRRVAVSSLASLAHGQLDEKEPFLTVHEPETESSFTHTGNISVLNNKSTVPFIELGLKKGQDGILEADPGGLGWGSWHNLLVVPRFAHRLPHRARSSSRAGLHWGGRGTYLTCYGTGPKTGGDCLPSTLSSFLSLSSSALPTL